MSPHAAFRPLSDMENDILAVSRWAGILSHIGCSASNVEADQIWVISNVLFELGQRLDARWNEAFDMAAGRVR